jgi:hypothetical protein
MDIIHIPKQITERFPYMFAGANIGLAVASGWCSTFEALCQDIDAELGQDKRGFHWCQCKEKLGVARWYWNMGPWQARPDRVRTLVDHAMAKTNHLCAVCGEPGQIDLQADWLLTLCPAHTPENRRQQKMDQRSRIKAPKGTGDLVLYLDFDGVLHHENVYWHPKRGAYIKAPARYTLFQHAPLLEQLLAPYPDIKIVLSTSWVGVYSCAKASKRLPQSLCERVIGATFHSKMDRDQFYAAPRGMQVWGDVVRRHPKDWIALDDDDLHWPKWCLDKYVKTHEYEGISDPLVFAEIERKLADMAACIDLRAWPC